ncbi:hypothetical protein LINPERPRIM_LOCUS30946 [Linum perenne]
MVENWDQKWGRLSAFSESNSLDPQLLDQRLFLAIWIQTTAIGRSRVARRWDLDDRQSRNLGSTGRPAKSTVRRSGGKENLNRASIRANSGSDRHGWTRTEEDWRWVMTLLASGEKEMRLLRDGRGLDDGGSSSGEAA